MDYHEFIKGLTAADEAERQAVRKMLFHLDEATVTPLIDQFYAGLSEVQGQAVLDVLAEIGGFEVLQLMEDIYHFDKRFESWWLIAEKTLKKEGRLLG